MEEQKKKGSLFSQMMKKKQVAVSHEGVNYLSKSSNSIFIGLSVSFIHQN